GILAIRFVAGLLYLLATINQTVRSKKTFWLEATIVAIFLVLGFVISSSVFNIAGYEVEFEYTETVQEQERLLLATNHVPPIVAGQSEKNPTTITPDIMEPLMTTPSWMKGADSARKLNTVLWSVVVGGLLYIIARLIIRKRVGAWVKPYLRNINTDLVDEVVYR